MMLDLVGLPKNANGFRTTHTCELCGFEPKTKNKYREKQDHLVMKHFKERIDKIFPHCRPYSCPNPECDFTGKDKQALLRHYTGKHGVLELYLREALAEKGIQYQLSDSAKRKSMGHSEQAAKRVREAPLQQQRALSSSTPPLTVIATAAETILGDQQPQQVYNSSSHSSPLGSPLSSSETVVMADTTTPQYQDYSDFMFMTSLPATTSAAAATTLAAAPISAATTTTSVSCISPGLNRRPQPLLPTMPTTKLPSMATVLTRSPSQIRCDVEALLASFQPIDAQLIFSLPQSGGGGTVLSHTNSQQIGAGGGGASGVDLDSHVVSSTTPDFFLPPTASSVLSDEQPGKLVLNDNIMWCGGSQTVLAEAAQTVPVNYLDPSEAGFVNISDIDFDYLYPATVEPTPPPANTLLAVGSNQERQLSFSML